MAEITIGGEEQTGDSGAPQHPDCDAEMEMTQVVRVEGASGMFWVCSDYSEETPVLNKSGVEMEPLKLR
jgi:hypothetical protein